VAGNEGLGAVGKSGVGALRGQQCLQGVQLALVDLE
jgi:hypothetical protein